MSLTVKSNISGISRSILHASRNINDAAASLRSGKKRSGDNIVSAIAGDKLYTSYKYNSSLDKSICTGVNALLAARSGLEQIKDIIVQQIKLANTSSLNNDIKLSILNTRFTKLTAEINRIAENTKFENIKLLTGEFGVERNRKLNYRSNFFSVSLVDKVAPDPGIIKFLRDNVPINIIETSLATIDINDVIEGDFINLNGEIFTFTTKPRGANEILLSAYNEVNARRLVTAILNNESERTEKYAASAVGEFVTIQSRVRSGRALPLISSNDVKFQIDNSLGQAQETVINLENINDNPYFIGTVVPNFTIDRPVLSGFAANTLAVSSGLDLSGVVVDMLNKAVKIRSKIGDKTYEGVMFLNLGQTIGHAVNNGDVGSTLIMRDTENEASYFTINFAPTNNLNLLAPGSETTLCDDLNNLFTRLSFRSTRTLQVNQELNISMKKILDPATMTASITSTNTKDKKIESVRIIPISETTMLVEIVLDGIIYSDNTVPRYLPEGSNISLETNNASFISINVGEGGLNLKTEQQIRSAEKTLLNFFTNREKHFEVQITSDGKKIASAIPSFTIGNLFLNEDSLPEDINILSRTSRIRAQKILTTAHTKVLDKIVDFTVSIDAIKASRDYLSQAVDVTLSAHRNITNADLVAESNKLTSNSTKLLSALNTQASFERFSLIISELIRNTEVDAKDERLR